MALKQRNAPASRKRTSDATSGDAGRPRGTGTAHYTVKGRRATAKQRETIDGCLAQAQEDGASRRVMIATIMCITQESGAGELAGVMTGNDDVGIFQQGRNWISEAGSKDPAKSTHAFLITGPTSWKKVHGGVKKAPGNLNAAIMKVQISIGGYGPWEKEATRTVDTWLDSGGGTGGGGTTTTTFKKRYNFTRGDKNGKRENSWDAAGRLVEEVGAYRWAAGNVFYAVSADELRAGAPSLTIHGDEAWLLKAPAFSWAINREIAEMSLEVLGDRWDVMPGAVVVMGRVFGPLEGRWLVWNVAGDRLDSPVLKIQLRRPTRLRLEPPNETGTRTTSSTQGGDGTTTTTGYAKGSGLYAICKNISDHRHAYDWGGGHGRLSSYRPSSGFDCSGSCSYALWKAGMFHGSMGIVSGVFASSWGKYGKGDEFTVWANDGHVWIEGYDDKGRFAWKFDTGYHGGKSGPAVSTNQRPTSGFTAKHWPGH